MVEVDDSCVSEEYYTDESEDEDDTEKFSQDLSLAFTPPITVTLLLLSGDHAKET